MLSLINIFNFINFINLKIYYYIFKNNIINYTFEVNFFIIILENKNGKIELIEYIINTKGKKKRNYFISPYINELR